MRKITYLFFFLIHYILVKKCYAIEIKAIALFYNPDDSFFKSIEESYNEYAEDAGIDTRLSIELHKFTNSSTLANDYHTAMESLLKKKDAYDLFFYDFTYTSLYYKHFLDVTNIVPEKQLSWYSNGIASNACTYKGRWFGLPVFLNYRVLYSNIELLNKYQKDIPKTWNEFLEFGKEILKKEKLEGNTDIIGYNGYIPDYDFSLSSVEEFIFSFRESASSPFPNYKNDEVKRALEKLKEIMNELSSEEIFHWGDEETVERLKNGKALFLKYWNYPIANEKYRKSLLLGEQEGISGSTLGGYGLSINSKILDKRKNSVKEIFKYITSKDTQRDYMIKFKTTSAVSSLYEEREPCEAVGCVLLKRLQSFYNNNNAEYNERYKKYVYNYLYGDATVEETVERIQSMNEYGFVSISPNESVEGFLIFILVVFFMVIMIASLRLLFIFKVQIFFKFLHRDLWIINVMGSAFILSSVLTEYGEKTSMKCRLRYILLPLGFTMIIVPIIFKLIINLPIKKDWIKWIRSHKYVFIILLMFIEVLFCLMLFVIPYDVIDHIGDIGTKGFKQCQMNNGFGKFILLSLFVGKAVLIIISFVLSYFQWNVSETKNDMRIINTTLYLYFLLSILLITVYSFKFTNHIGQFIMHSLVTILFALINYLFMYFTNIISIIKHRNELDQLNLRNSLNILKNKNGEYNRTVTDIQNNGRLVNTESQKKPIRSKGHYHGGSDTIIENANFGSDVKSKFNDENN